MYGAIKMMEQTPAPGPGSHNNNDEGECECDTKEERLLATPVAVTRKSTSTASTTAAVKWAVAVQVVLVSVALLSMSASMNTGLEEKSDDNSWQMNNVAAEFELPPLLMRAEIEQKQLANNHNHDYFHEHSRDNDNNDNVVLASSSINSIEQQYTEPDPVQPTLLSVVDHETGEFVNAAANSLYKQFKQKLQMAQVASLESNNIHRDSVSPEKGALRLHQEEILIHDSLTVYWSEEIEFASPSTSVLEFENNNAVHSESRSLAEAGEETTMLKQRRQVQEEDIMALYCPAHESDPTKFRDAFTIQQARVMMSPTNHGPILPQASVHIPSFPVVREDTCEFRLYGEVEVDHGLLGLPHDGSIKEAQYKSSSFHLLARSPEIKLTLARETPLGMHIALTGNPSEMLVQFNTGNIHGTPVVAYGKAPQDDDPDADLDLTLKQEGTSATYAAEDMCNEPANVTDVGSFVDPGLFHAVTLTGLESDQWYAYKVGVTGGQGIVWSEVHKFQSAPYLASNDDDEDADADHGYFFSNYTFSFLVYADQGVLSNDNFYGAADTVRYTTREVKEHNARMVHHFGDLSYARGVGHIWDQWMSLIQPFASSAPFMVGIGNHEYGYISEGGDKDPSGETHEYQPKWGNFCNDSGGECGVPTSARFTMPAESSGGNGVFWHSYNFASVHTIMLSSEHDLSANSKQYQWFLTDLKSVNRTITPWVIVETHRPLYESELFPDQAKVGLWMRHEVEGLLYDYKVDLVLSGHYHSYQRSCAGLYKDKCNNGGPTHLTIGTAGAKHYAAILYPQHWTVTTLSNYGLGKITVHNSSALHFEFLANEYDGGVLDAVWLTK
jgi:hypothetical protein